LPHEAERTVPEDADDKVRRNLVGFSAAVLLVAWLNVPVQGWLQDALKVKTELVAWKTWAAALAVLLYLTLRYRFSPDAEKLVNGLEREYSSVRFAGILKLTTTDGERAFAQGRTTPVFGPNLLQIRQDLLKAHPEIETSPEHRVEFQVEEQEQGNPWKGRIRISVIRRTSPNAGQVLGPPRLLVFEVPRATRWKVRTRAFLLSWVYSGTSVNFLIPVALALLAGAVAIAKIISALR
jgi:hypothetical protein